MSRFLRSVENYVGPVEIYGDTGELVVTARANYQVHERIESGLKEWHGALTRINPEFCLQPSSYRLRRPDGAQGTILVANIRISSTAPEIIRFAGSGPAPGFE